MGPNKRKSDRLPKRRTNTMRSAQRLNHNTMPRRQPMISNMRSQYRKSMINVIRSWLRLNEWDQYSYFVVSPEFMLYPIYPSRFGLFPCHVDRKIAHCIPARAYLSIYLCLLSVLCLFELFHDICIG